MTIPSSLYVAWQGVETYFVDKDTGLPLSAGRVEFYKDVGDRTTPKDVFQLVSMPNNTYNFVNIGHVVTLTSVGTFGSPSDGSDIQVYAFPYDSLGNFELYHMKIYSSGNILQFTRDAQPANAQNNSVTDNFEGSENQIENPQFVETFLPYTHTQTFSVSGASTETKIAPDWSLITDGTGTIVVTLLDLTEVIPSDAPFALKIEPSGGSLASVKLRQQITQSPRLLGSNARLTGPGFVSGSFVSKSFGSNEVQLIMRYTASNAYTVDLVNQTTSADNQWNTLINASSTEINTTNQDPGSTGYVNIEIIIPVGESIGITSIQMVSVENASSTTEFLQESTPRQIDHLFHYYKPLLNYKPISSFLVAWEFQSNPAQFGASISAPAIGANKSQYFWDQTIVFQSVNSGVSASRAARGSLKLTAASTTQMAIIQYLSREEISQILDTKLSVNVLGFADVNTICTISLWYTKDASLPNIKNGTNNSLVGALNAQGKPIAPFNGTWTEITRGTRDNASFILTSTNIDHGFSGWDPAGTSDIGTATFFAIVLGTASIASSNTITLTSISLVPGDIPTRPAPQSTDEVLRECQYYYEKSYSNLILPGALTLQGSLVAFQRAITSGGVNSLLLPDSFGFIFNTRKCTTVPTIIIYDPNNGALATVFATVLSNGSIVGQSDASLSNWAQSDLNAKSVNYLPSTASTLTSGLGITNPTGYIQYHYVVDARLGTF